jgi:predicted transcriptional regulator
MPLAMSTSTVPMSIRLDASSRERLKAIAARQKRSAHALATEAIERLIEQKEREFAWHESCEAALKHFDETGLHATHDEVMTWMDSWGKDTELPAPVCHP